MPSSIPSFQDINMSETFLTYSLDRSIGKSILNETRFTFGEWDTDNLRFTLVDWWDIVFIPDFSMAIDTNQPAILKFLGVGGLPKLSDIHGLFRRIWMMKIVETHGENFVTSPARPSLYFEYFGTISILPDSGFSVNAMRTKRSGSFSVTDFIMGSIAYFTNFNNHVTMVYGLVAQLVEQIAFNNKVMGSNPIQPTRII